MTEPATDAESRRSVAAARPARRHSREGRSVAAGVALLSWVFPRVGPLKFTEVLALVNAPRALTSARTLQRVLSCYGPFLLATLLAGLAALFTLGNGDNSITSQKGLYSSPELTTVITLVRTLTYVVVVASVTHFFRVSSESAIQRALNWSYILTLAPGFLQMFRLYSGIHFDLPYFERPGFGPFSGVFDAGYMRLMGFEFEPLGYGTSLLVVCCLRFHARGTIPWMGIFVLGHTFSAGALVAFAIALVLGYSARLRRAVVPVYLFAFIVLCVAVWTYLDELLAIFMVSVSVSERINALGACINMWLDHPFGVGAGLYGYFMNLYDKANFPAPQLDWYPNNDPAMFLAYGGVLYLLAYLWVFHYALSSTPSRWIRIALVGLLVQSVSSYMIFNPAAVVIIAMALSGKTPLPAARKIRKSTTRNKPELQTPAAIA